VAPSAAVVLLASPDDGAALDRALALGARGFLAPDVGRPELSAVAAHILASPVLAASNGRAPGVDVPSPAVAHEGDANGRPGAVRALSPVAVDENRAPQEPLGPVPTGVATGAALTKREIEVLIGMSNGRSNAQIGAELFLSEDTVKTHARRLFRKLGAKDRAQAVAIGLRRGLIR
jgi:DNA-binding NarL/FixJ family response regulator